ncbi:hypothetical protein PV325_011545 [Microctonus aethiopoides]|nr:hypothetical protein PV325_011545 [Microctonus aethiopoides]
MYIIIYCFHNLLETLEQGKRRLKRAFKKKDVESTDSENNNNEKIVKSKSVTSARKELNAVTPISLTNECYTADSSPAINELPGINNNNDENPQFATSNSESGTLCNDERFRIFEKKIFAELESIKRSMLYDFDKKNKELKHILMNMSNCNNCGPKQNLTGAKEGLECDIPTKNIDEFLALEENLSEFPNKKKALLDLYRILISGESKVQSCILKLGAATIGKDVQLLYSGTGKKINGVGKLNFSGTHTYTVMQDSLIEKFGNSLNLKSLPGDVGRWLSGANDRNGGRKEREKK